MLKSSDGRFFDRSTADGEISPARHSAVRRQEGPTNPTIYCRIIATQNGNSKRLMAQDAY
jgi:hypothetical protein